MKKIQICIGVFFSIYALSACNKDVETSGFKRELSWEALEANQPGINGELAENKVKLGRVLFYDEVLSVNERISCGTCHQQSKAFSDGLKLSRGFASGETSRNSPGIGNLENHSQFFWDAREMQLSEQVMIPILNHIEMGHASMEDVIHLISQRDYYSILFEDAFGDDEVTESRIASALSMFVKSLNSEESDFEESIESNGGFVPNIWDASIAPDEFREGAQLFDELGCDNCHFGSDLGGFATANIGLDMVYADPGRAGWTGIDSHQGEFKIPSLRNVALTAPYMHDGRFNTLEEVVEHYNSGIMMHPNLDWTLTNLFDLDTETLLEQGVTMDQIDNATSLDDLGISVQPRRMNLTELQKQALVRFLRSLTDDNFIRNPRFSDPFVLVATH